MTLPASLMSQLEQLVRKELPCIWLPNHFDAWHHLMHMVKDHVYMLSTCKTFRGVYEETHRRLKLLFVDWPCFDQRSRLRIVTPLLCIGDRIFLEISHCEVKCTVVSHSRSKRVFEFMSEDETIRVKVSKITNVQLI